MSLSFDDADIFKVLLQVCKRYGVDPLASIDCEIFFRNLLGAYEGMQDISTVTSWLSFVIPTKFPALGERPSWLQASEWPFSEGKPMVFVGQIDWHREDSPMEEAIFHDDTSFYLFAANNVAPTVVMQQM